MSIQFVSLFVPYYDAQVPLISLSVFVFAFSLGFGPIPWLMMSELFAPEVKLYQRNTNTKIIKEIQIKK